MSLKWPEQTKTFGGKLPFSLLIAANQLIIRLCECLSKLKWVTSLLFACLLLHPTIEQSAILDWAFHTHEKLYNTNVIAYVICVDRVKLN